MDLPEARDTYIDGIYEETASGACGSGLIEIRKLYQAFGRTIAERKGGTLSYLLADQLGSTVGTIDAATGGAPSARYYPFGTQRSASGTMPTDKLYTGQQQEPNSATGAYFYHARFYSSKAAHFMSADTLTVDGLNRYAYTRGNPASYTDPSGLDMVCLFWCTGSGDIIVDDGRCHLCEALIALAPLVACANDLPACEALGGGGSSAPPMAAPVATVTPFPAPPRVSQPPIATPLNCSERCATASTQQHPECGPCKLHNILTSSCFQGSLALIAVTAVAFTGVGAVAEVSEIVAAYGASLASAYTIGVYLGSSSGSASTIPPFNLISGVLDCVP